MSHASQVENMLRNFEQIDKPKKVEFIPSNEDYCILINGKSDGFSYHYTTIIESISNGFKLEPNEQFVRMIHLTNAQLQHFIENKKF